VLVKLLFLLFAVVVHIGLTKLPFCYTLSGKTPLTCAVSRGKVIAVRYLIAKGADLNKQDAMGFTPLHYAVKRGSPFCECLHFYSHFLCLF
jgi:ankyrin repeat protein